MMDATFLARALTLIGAMFLAYVLTMWGVLVYWTVRDIRSRTSDRNLQILAITLVLLGNLPGLLLYLALRPPETSTEMLARQMETAALGQELDRQPACVGCAAAMRPEWVLCPYCRTSIQSACTACSRNIRPSWVLCPYCGADRADAPSVAGPRSVPTRARPAGAPALQPAASTRAMLRPAKDGVATTS